MATFSREINTAPSLGACVMARFQEGAVFIWFLAGGCADVFCVRAWRCQAQLAGPCAACAAPPWGSVSSTAQRSLPHAGSKALQAKETSKRCF